MITIDDSLAFLDRFIGWQVTIEAPGVYLFQKDEKWFRLTTRDDKPEKKKHNFKLVK